jgi:hypothetical protein
MPGGHRRSDTDTDHPDGEEKPEHVCALHRVVSRYGMGIRTVAVSRLLILWWGVMDGFSTADRAAVGLLKPRSLHHDESNHDEKEVA